MAPRTWLAAGALLAVLWGAGRSAAACVEESALQEALQFALDQLAATAAKRSTLRYVDNSGDVSRGFPNSTHPETGEWQVFKAEKWTSGDSTWAELGAAELSGLKKAATWTKSHMTSHIFDSSYGEALAAAVPGAAVEAYQEVMKTAAASLAKRYSEAVGAIRSWRDIDEPEFIIIIDSAASLKIMWEAAAMPGGKKKWADMALSHAKKLAKDHFREDGSVYHGVTYDSDTGEVLWRGTFQGYGNETTWARGQAWAVVGFTHIYNVTREPAMLATAQRAADYYLRRLPEAEDLVPRWDFDAPDDQPWKDSSAAAIAASGLLRLGQLTGNDTYTGAGAAIVEALVGGYLGWKDSGLPLDSILRNGTFNAPKGHHSTGLIWGDWYFMDALSLLLPTANSTCS